MNTYFPKAGDADRRWYLIDAEGQVLGRLATTIASILRGKNKPGVHASRRHGRFCDRRER